MGCSVALREMKFVRGLTFVSDEAQHLQINCEVCTPNWNTNEYAGSPTHNIHIHSKRWVIRKIG